MNSTGTEKFRSPVMMFGLILLVLGLIVAFLALLSMDPSLNDDKILLAALGRIGTGIAFQILGLGLVYIGRK